ncbi:hypothetical protein MMC07_000362 [Pseudocyphellaria aurata]|nr:hypothetical protein [Pseudocyphellaria aurata]
MDVDHFRACIKDIKSVVGDHLKPFIYATLLFSGVTWFLITAALKRKKCAINRVSSPDSEKSGANRGSSFKAPVRVPGVWTPVDFKRPAAAPYPNWDVRKTEPIPYRPFKYGPNQITMGLRNMVWDEWIELDNQFLEWHAVKAKRIEERGDQCCRTAPEAFDGAIELLEELCSYLPQRYPTLFRQTPTGIHNLLTHETFSLTLPLAVDPMEIVGRLVQDDVAIMFERADGQYYLLAGSILLAGFWRLSDKFGMPLSEIHTSGSVPQYDSKLRRGMENFFRRMQPANPVLRNNYLIQADDNLAWSTALASEDDDAAIAQHAGWSSAQKSTVAESHYFRSERQSLRRLPRSGGVVFTIRTYFELITKVASERGVPGRLASAIRSWGPDTAIYKGRDRFGDVLVDYLDTMHRAQVARGEIAEHQDGDNGNAYPL